MKSPSKRALTGLRALYLRVSGSSWLLGRRGVGNTVESKRKVLEMGVRTKGVKDYIYS